MKSNQSNPFSTRFVAPGEIAWVENAYRPQQLAQLWMQHGRRAAIVGPHGSGKSTLLENLVPLIGLVTYRRNASGEVLSEANGNISPNESGETVAILDRNKLSTSTPARNLVWLSLRKACPASMPIPWKYLQTGSTLVVDGYEQLNYFARILILFKTHRRGIGLLVTAHRKTWLPTLCKLSVTPELAKQIAERLVRDAASFKVPTASELEAALLRNRGNFREVLMEMYDEFEERRR